MVYTKSSNIEAKRFSGLFYSRLTDLLSDVAEQKEIEYQEYSELLAEHESLIDAYDASLDARNEALHANGQIDSLPTTTTTTNQSPKPRNRSAESTTTLQANTPETVVVPETVKVPPVFEVEPVQKFSWVGGGNAGVRSWTKDNGDDYLSVLRNSGDVPAALVEFLYLTNPHEAELLEDETYLDQQALVLADSITEYFSTSNEGSGFVRDQTGDQNIGNSGGKNQCAEPELE